MKAQAHDMEEIGRWVEPTREQWEEYERRKMALPPMDAGKHAAACREIARELEI